VLGKQNITAVSPGDHIAVWFSCGVASAVAAKKTIELYGYGARVSIVNSPIVEEHPDNRRFLLDVQEWLGEPILEAKNVKHPSQSCVEVWRNKGYMGGVHGAPCTLELKKKARRTWQDLHRPHWHVLGFTADEQKRSDRFIKLEVPTTLPVLTFLGITKADCFDIVRQAGIKLPEMYLLGYPNANCIGCVKATSPTYWNHVRKTHPEVFEARAEQSRRIGARLVRVKGERIFLDDLPEDAVGRPMKSEAIECGVFCEERGEM